MRVLPLLLPLLMSASVARAQGHHEHGRPPPDVSQAGEEPERAMQRRGPLGIPRSRQGSGTGWLPDASEMRAIHGSAGGFQLMLHYNLFGGYDYQSGDAGAGQAVSTNWLMGMAAREVLGGELEARAMLSLEPLTVGADGYPLLLQTGESFEGRPLVDRQHPHDLFMETALMYTRPLGSRVALQVYGGPAAEPALGPVAFPHRPSAWADPLAPLGHHWLDSTHITFGVVSAGLMTRTVKLEGSWFNGREPDEARYDFDLRGFDSYSTRLSLNPGEYWSMQGSYGFLKSPEQLEPAVSVRRYTASVSHAARWGEGRGWATTAAVGFNDPSAGELTHSLLLESSLDLAHLGVTYLRLEQLRKEAHDFGLEQEGRFSMASLALGHVHAFPVISAMEPALGVRVSGNLVDSGLESRYGTRFPVGVMAYVRLTPEKM